MRRVSREFQQSTVGFVLACAALALGGCASAPVGAIDGEPRAIAMVEKASPVRSGRGDLSADVDIAARAADTARSLLGAPYRYGGTSPAGFDCSGLVHYSFREAGASVPRTSHELFRSTRAVPIEEARAGDLVFFRLADKVSHVGIYLDEGRFVHAPSTGKRVEIASLESEWYRSHFVRAGRITLE